jgi:AcrR family transcriptional regulator
MVCNAGHVTTFRRAHSPEQREVRRSAILETTAQMLDEMPAAEISLNELSRRVGMAKSNVLRYFESREAVLLELSTTANTEWLDEFERALAATIAPGDPPSVRADQLARTAAMSLAAHPVLCDLISEQAGVLEHNISTEAVLDYKKVSVANFERLSGLVKRHLPELDATGASRFAALASMLAASVWTHSHPPPAVVAAYEAEPSLAPYRLEFVAALTDALKIVLAGLLV